MKLFISHSLSDVNLLTRIKDTLEPYGITLLIAEHVQELEKTITQKIENMIIEADIAVIMLTENGFNSNFVHQEIGYLKSQKKPSVQLVQSGFESRLSGFNFGKDYILYDPNSPEKAIDRTKKTLLNFWNKKVEKELAIQRTQNMNVYKAAQLRQAKEKKQLNVGLGVFAGVVALGMIFGGE